MSGETDAFLGGVVGRLWGHLGATFSVLDATWVHPEVSGVGFEVCTSKPSAKGLGLALLCVALLCFVLLCFTLLYFASLYVILLCFALLYFTFLCFALLYFALLCFALLCLTLLYFN